MLDNVQDISISYHPSNIKLVITWLSKSLLLNATKDSRETCNIIKWVGRITSFEQMNTKTPTINASFPREKSLINKNKDLFKISSLVCRTYEGCGNSFICWRRLLMCEPRYF